MQKLNKVDTGYFCSLIHLNLYVNIFKFLFFSSQEPTLMSIRCRSAINPTKRIREKIRKTRDFNSFFLNGETVELSATSLSKNSM